MFGVVAARQWVIPDTPRKGTILKYSVGGNRPCDLVCVNNALLPLTGKVH